MSCVPEPRAPAPGVPRFPVVPGYDVVEEIGRGGMGVVYKAWQSGLKRLVALKMIHSGPAASLEQAGRLRAEAEAAARLQHPNVVQIHEVGAVDGLPFLAMEYVDGGSLAERLDGTPQPAVLAAAFVRIFFMQSPGWLKIGRALLRPLL